MQRWLTSFLVLGTLAVLAGAARAERTPMMRTPTTRSQGFRPDITVPYLTTGNSAFGAYSVAPRIYSSPVLDDPNPGTKPVFNLIFYGARQAFGDFSNGATPK